MPLADAMAKFPRSFPPVYVAMVRAGETGGFIDVVLSQIADFQARDQELKGRVKAALIYPCVLAFIACGVLIFLMTFFIPRFSKIFAEFGSALAAHDARSSSRPATGSRITRWCSSARWCSCSWSGAARSPPRPAAGPWNG